MEYMRRRMRKRQINNRFDLDTSESDLITYKRGREQLFDNGGKNRPVYFFEGTAPVSNR
jgi:hypothetical protein